MSIFKLERDSTIISSDDYVENAGLPDNFDLDSAYNIAIYGRSRSGKGVIINSLMCHYYFFKVDPENIYIFSPSFKSDKTYQAARNYLRY